MRFLPALLLIAAPLFAQESDADRQRAEEERAAEEAERAALQGDLAAKEARQKAYLETAEELRRAAEQRSKWGMTEQELRRFIEELRSKSEAKREEAMAAIKRANASIDDLLPLVAQALENAERARGALGAFQLGGLAGTRTLLLDTNRGSSEVISGSADGTDYTLKSLGEGKYELNATRRADDGKVMEETKDQGTLKELQEKYAFLRSGLGFAIQMPAQPLPSAVTSWRGRVLTSTVQGPATAAAWGGGGKVGVLVMPPSEDLGFHLQLPEGAGFIVMDVIAGSRAEQIGIRRMDILLRLDGELIDTPVQLKRLHEKTGVLEIIRRSETKKIDLATIVEEAKPAQIAVEPVPDAPAPADPK